MLGRLAAQLRQHLLKPAHACFAGVAADDRIKRFIVHDQLIFAQAVLLHLLGQQVTACDQALFLRRVGRQLDNLHTVEQRTRNGRKIVRSRQEHHVGQIKRQFNVVVAEGNILLGVQHFKHRRCRIAAEVVAHLVNLVEQDERVGSTGTAQRIHNTAGHCADVGLAVTADIRLITHTAEAHARVVAAHGLCNGLGNRGLADTRRADQTQHLPLEVGRKALDGKELHNAFLDLLHAIVVAVEDRLRFREIMTFLALLIPRQVEHGIQISTYDTLLGRRAAQLGKAVHLTDELVLALLRQLEVKHTRAVAFRFCGYVLFAELSLNDLDLLAQVVFLLVFVDLGLEFVLNLVFDLKDLGLLTEHADHHHQAAGNAKLFEDLLLGCHIDRNILGDIVSQIARIAALGYGQLHIGRQAGRILCVLTEALLRGAHECLRAAFGHAVNVVLEFLNLGIHAVLVLLGGDKVVRECAGLTLDQHADIVARQTQDLANLADRADLVQVARRRRIGFQFALRGQEDGLAVLHRRFQCANRHHSAHIKVDDHIRERRQSAQRQHRQAAEDDSVKLCHMFVSPCTENCLLVSV